MKTLICSGIAALLLAVSGSSPARGDELDDRMRHDELMREIRNLTRASQSYYQPPFQSYYPQVYQPQHWQNRPSYYQPRQYQPTRTYMVQPWSNGAGYWIYGW